MQSIADDVWELTSSHTMSGGLVWPVRTTVIRLAEGLWIHSPIALSDDDAAAIEAQGPVRHIVAPSRMHDSYVLAAVQRWPEAQLHAPTELLEALGLDGTPLVDATWPELDVMPLQGTEKTREVVFVHRPSRTLLVTDLVFHFDGPAENWPTAFLRWAIGCRGRLAASRSWRYVFADDMAALSASVERVMALDFDRLVPCHGAVVETDAKARLGEALSGRIP